MTSTATIPVVSAVMGSRRPDVQRAIDDEAQEERIIGDAAASA
jgi:hypothetical protein